MGIFGNLFKKQTSATNATPQPEPKVSNVAPPIPAKTQKHQITGVSHYEKNIMKLAIKNPEYSLSMKQIIKAKLDDEYIYQYKFAPIKTELIPEPSNPYDPNAIKVLIDGEHIGYIKKGSCSRVLKLIREDRIEKIDCRIYGGAYKYISIYNEKQEEELVTDKKDLKIEITICEK